MERDGHEDVNFFIGTEVENLPTKSKKTLFVVGVQDVDEILRLADKHSCQAIYFGANQSFCPNTTEELTIWENMIDGVLRQSERYCILDFDISTVEWILESFLVENHKFIPVVSAKIPYIDQLGYNAVLKIDDKDFKASNPGVWVHRIRDLMDIEKFTPWSDYDDDEVI